VGDHLNGGCFRYTAEERERLFNICLQGLRTSVVAGSLAGLQCPRILGVQEGTAPGDSEFELLLVCLMRPYGMGTEELRRIALQRLA
jgi:hypothetical protein